MIHLSWNCQGLGRTLTRNALDELVKKWRPKVIFLSETRMKEENMKKIIKELQYPNYHCVDPCGTAGGLALIWSNDVELDVVFESKNLLDSVIKVDGGEPFRVSWFYGPSRDEDKSAFWNGIMSFENNLNLPWLCIGDFNELLWPHEKQGGNEWSLNKRRFLRDFMDAHDLSDLGFKGQQFTWKSNWETAAGHIFERLDRGVADMCWLEKWPNTTVSHCTRVGSDHNPIIVDIDPIIMRNPRNFKFDANWAKEDECRKIIEESWDTVFQGNTASQWAQKL